MSPLFVFHAFLFVCLLFASSGLDLKQQVASVAAAASAAAAAAAAADMAG